VLAAGKGRVLPVLAMLAAKRRLRVAVRGSGPGAKRRRPCPPLRAAAAGRRRGEERPEPSTSPPAGRTRNRTRCFAPRLPRRSQCRPLIRLGPDERSCLRQHRPMPGAVRRSDLVDPFARGANDVAAGGAAAFDVPVGLLAGAGGDRSVPASWAAAKASRSASRRAWGRGPAASRTGAMRARKAGPGLVARMGPTRPMLWATLR